MQKRFDDLTGMRIKAYAMAQVNMRVMNCDGFQEIHVNTGRLLVVAALLVKATPGNFSGKTAALSRVFLSLFIISGVEEEPC